ncbi:MAG: Sec-dependent nitrous-oxide reductase [Flavobacteriales bacterium]|nr:Sec-dependent nitrous-oxide reductase [Flavobacteriales bacterium]MBK9287054.1 Sec-dependent nitrous-oxide reductase [Flavobacteriales bacterium]
MKRPLFMTGALMGVAAGAFLLVNTMPGCRPSTTKSVVTGDAASKVYVKPGSYDEFYNFVSGGFSGQLSVYGIPSGRMLRNIPVFSVNPESGWGFSEETKPMLMTTHGFIPWDDSHHPELSMTDGVPDGKWCFINGNNTPRIALVDLGTFRTKSIVEIPNCAGNHSSPFTTPNSEYVISGTRFSVPMGDDAARDVPIESYRENFKGTVSFIHPDTVGKMSIAFQIITPGVNFDLSHTGKGPSDGWFFFSCYNSEQAYSLLEVNASQRDKDFIMAVNWKKAEQYAKEGKGRKVPGKYYSNWYNDETHSAESTVYEEVLQLDPRELKDIVYFMPCPKSPHGCDVDPTGKYIVGSGKLAALIPVFSFEKIQKAIAANDLEGDFMGIPVLKYTSVLHGEVKKPGLGPLHTEFDDKGNAYTSFFVSSEIVKWNVEKLEVLDRVPTYYSIGHLCVPGGDSKKPWGKYVIAYNKITKDRYLPTGPELAQSAQLYSIDGDKMELLLDFPTIGEPHYAQAIPAELVKPREVKFFKIDENKHPYVAKGEKETKIERRGNEVHVWMTTIRSHFAPDNIEGVKMGDVVYFHVTNLEQDWDVPHGFAIKGAATAELLVMPGETQTLKWIPDQIGVTPMYCTDFCSALHQEMQGYVRVSPANSTVPLKAETKSVDSGS